MQRLFFDLGKQNIYSLNESFQLKLLYQFPKFRYLQFIGVSTMNHLNCTIRLHFLGRVKSDNIMDTKHYIVLLNYCSNLIAIVQQLSLSESFIQYYFGRRRVLFMDQHERCGSKSFRIVFTEGGIVKLSPFGGIVKITNQFSSLIDEHETLMRNVVKVLNECSSVDRSKYEVFQEQSTFVGALYIEEKQIVYDSCLVDFLDLHSDGLPLFAAIKNETIVDTKGNIFVSTSSNRSKTMH